MAASARRCGQVAPRTTRAPRGCAPSNPLPYVARAASLFSVSCLLSPLSSSQSPSFSLRGSGRFRVEQTLADPAMWSGFNPLHCGAVVASKLGAIPRISRNRVSIPFIAGQWSLLDALEPALSGRRRVSIPFIAGQWSLPTENGVPRMGSKCFNPLHCGAVVASNGPAKPSFLRIWVSIPFIAGQWSLPWTSSCMAGSPARMFQSPSLRGSGRFEEAAARAALAKFQSPSLRGSGRFGGGEPPGGNALKVSIPFIAGQWSLHGGGHEHQQRSARFNPLHCGAVVASRRRDETKNRPGAPEFQSPSLRGSGRFRPTTALVIASAIMFQSPSLRGSGRFSARALASACARHTFQSPSLRGSGRFPGAGMGGQGHAQQVSIPFIAGQWSLPIRPSSLFM